MAVGRMLVAAALLMGMGSARAATVSLQIKAATGQPLADAVITIVPAARPSGPIRFPWPYVVAQQNISFQPHVLIVPVGASVTFPNRDKVRHHVYSFSKVKKFELKLYGRDESRSVVFDKPGVVPIGCNIHDVMSGYIIVVDTPFAAKTDAQGNVQLPAVPAGGATLTVWHPSIRARENEFEQKLTVPAAGLATTISTR